MNRLKQFRRIATHYEKLAITCLGLIHLVAAYLVIHEGSGRTFFDKSAGNGPH